MKIVSRSEWGARYDDGFGPAPLPVGEVFLHHSVTAAPDLVAPFDDDHMAIRQLEEIGQSRFGGGISYTWLVTPAGLIFEGHGVGRRGAHTKGHNATARAICLVGGYQENAPTAAQLDAVVWLLRHGKVQGWLREARITGGHRDVKQTECPGDRAYALIGEINRRATGVGAAIATPDVEFRARRREDLPILRYGDEGEDVRYLQMFMTTVFEAYNKYPVTGRYLDKTAAGIKEFQRRTGIDGDGRIVGPKVAIQQGAAAGGSQAPVVNSWVSTS